MSTQTIRAILFASATRTGIGGLRSSIPPSQVPDPAIGWTCRFIMTLLAPIISNRRKIAPSAECLRGRREGNQSRSDQRPNSCDRHQPARHLILFGAPTDLGVELGDLIVEADLRLDQNQQRCPSFLRQATCRILYDRTQACCVCCPLGNHLPKFRQVAAKHIDRLSALTDQ